MIAARSVASKFGLPTGQLHVDGLPGEHVSRLLWPGNLHERNAALITRNEGQLHIPGAAFLSEPGLTPNSLPVAPFSRRFAYDTPDASHNVPGYQQPLQRGARKRLLCPALQAQPASRSLLFTGI